ncbi:MAG: type II toxin-antitoxin system HicA family toxin [Pseudomonadota bacterium]
MNSKYKKILADIFSHPTPGNLEWRKIESLFSYLGAVSIEGSGSRVSFILNNEKADFHRPHPGKEAKRYQVKNAMDFLIRAGVKP